MCGYPPTRSRTMTVSTEVNQAAYTGNGVTTVFPYTFRILNSANLTVTRIDLLEVETVLVLGTDYTVTGAGSYNGGSVTLINPLPNGYGIIIERDLSAVQETDLRNQGTFFAEVHEDVFDYLTMLIQQALSWVGLALKRPNSRSSFYDAKQYRIANIANPSGEQDAVNNRSMKSYVDQAISGVIGGFGWFLQAGAGAVYRTFQSKMRESVSILDFGGAIQGKNNDSTAAFVSAYATGKPVYVPHGDWYTTVYNRHQTYGDGVVYSNDADSYSDAGSRPIPPHPDNSTQFTTYHATRGNAERAAGRAKIINNPNGRVQVSKFSDPSQYATYVNSDHVGEYRSMYAPRNFVSTLAASTTYNVNSMSSPEIIAGANIQVGDFVNTTHSPRYKAKILEINLSTNTVTVDGWYAAGNQASGQIPANGFSANINKADKIWGENTVVYLDQFGLTATGYELGFLVSVQQGTPVWGFHAANYSTTYTLDQAFRATGLWLTGYYVGPGVLRGIRHEVGSNDYTTIRTENTIADTWTGSVIDLQTSFPKSTSHLAKITQGAVTLFSIDSRGQRSTQRESYGVVSASTTLTGLSASEISCINATADTITLTLSSTSCVTGQKFNIRATDGPVIVDGYTLNDANGRFICVMWDGSTFIRRFQTN